MRLESSEPVPAAELYDARFSPMLGASALAPFLLERVPLSVAAGAAAEPDRRGLLRRVGVAAHRDRDSRVLVVSPQPAAYETVTDAAVAVWGDEFHNPYTVRTYRGTLTGDVRLHYGKEDDAVVAEGLFDLGVAGRAVAASHALRRLGIEAENIVGVSAPQAYVHGGQRIAPEEFNRALLGAERARIRRWLEAGAITSEEGRQYEAMAKTYLATHTFGVLQRDELTPLRLRDLRRETHDALAAEVSRLHRAVNVLNPDKRQRVLDGDDVAAAEPTRDDIDHLITVVAPRKLGRNLATLHNHGTVYDGGLTPRHITICGGMGELEHVRGRLVGLDASDKQVGEADYLANFWLPIRETGPNGVDGLRQALFGYAAHAEQGFDADPQYMELHQRFIGTYAQAYCAQREGMDVTDPNDAGMVRYWAALAGTVSARGEATPDQVLAVQNKIALQQGMREHLQAQWEAGQVTPADVLAGISLRQLTNLMAPLWTDIVGQVEPRQRQLLERELGDAAKVVFPGSGMRKRFLANVTGVITNPTPDLQVQAIEELAERISFRPDAYADELLRLLPNLDRSARMVGGNTIIDFTNVPLAYALQALSAAQPDGQEYWPDVVVATEKALGGSEPNALSDRYFEHHQAPAGAHVVTDRRRTYALSYHRKQIPVVGVRIRSRDIPIVATWLARPETSRQYTTLNATEPTFTRSHLSAMLRSLRETGSIHLISQD